MARFSRLARHDLGAALPKSSRVDRVAGAGPKGSPSSLGLATVASFRLASLDCTPPQPPSRQEVAERSQSELTSNLLIPKEQRPMASIFSAGSEPNSASSRLRNR